MSKGKSIKRFCPKDKKRYKVNDLPCRTCEHRTFFGDCPMRKYAFDEK